MSVLNGRPAASGRSICGVEVGSYSLLCSRANMLLFLTRDAFFRFSMDDRRVIEGEISNDIGGDTGPKRVGEVPSLVCQKDRGEFGLNGEESNGDDSRLRTGFNGCSRG